jgi:hypothetical protein
MRVVEFIDLMRSSGCRYSYIGDDFGGVFVALDVEGRLFSCMDGKVLSRVNPDAFTKVSTGGVYYNPGGDGLWPAPEGSRLGYEYSTGDWRVPPGITGARWVETAPGVVNAEIDLINNEGIGLPCRFGRKIEVVRSGTREMTVNVVESIEYLGQRSYGRDEVLLVPWSLCQFDCGAGSRLIFSDGGEGSFWDMYAPSAKQCRIESGKCIVDLCTAERFQIGMSSAISCLRFEDAARALVVERRGCGLPSGLDWIDICDRSPAEEPDGRPVVLSAYCDPSGFMEVESAGGCPKRLEPGFKNELRTETWFRLD